jgi:hypothetical protein
MKIKLLLSCLLFIIPISIQSMEDWYVTLGTVTNNSSGKVLLTIKKPDFEENTHIISPQESSIFFKVTFPYPLPASASTNKLFLGTQIALITGTNHYKVEQNEIPIAQKQFDNHDIIDIEITKDYEIIIELKKYQEPNGQESDQDSEFSDEEDDCYQKHEQQNGHHIKCHCQIQ